MTIIQVRSDKNGGQEHIDGSDNRLNTSSRSDSRGYYNSRDESETYTMVFDDASATANDFVAYLKNTKADGKHLVVDRVEVYTASATGVFKLHTVDSSVPPAGGSAISPTNLNQGGIARTSTSDAQGPSDSSATPMTIASTLDQPGITGTSGAFALGVIKMTDELRLGQNQAIALEYDAGTADSRVFGTIYFFFEAAK